jgi:antitoxin (DNA-binding transcriptional repressor) of toxin-antitoxin stability system
MKASFVDLRKKSAEIIRAIERNERITLYYRGRPKAVIVPIGGEAEKPTINAEDHPAFGMWADRDDMKDVAGYVRNLRKRRYSALRH